MKRAFGQLEAELGVALGAQGEAAAKRTCACAMVQHSAAAALQAHDIGAHAPGGHGAHALDVAAYQAFAKYVKCNGEDCDDDQHYSEHYLAHREWWLNYAASMPQAMCAE